MTPGDALQGFATGMALFALFRIAAFLRDIRHLLGLTGELLAKLGDLYVTEAKKKQP